MRSVRKLPQVFDDVVLNVIAGEREAAPNHPVGRQLDRGDFEGGRSHGVNPFRGCIDVHSDLF